VRTPLQVIRDARSAPTLRRELAEAREERDEAIIVAAMCDLPGQDDEPGPTDKLDDLEFPDAEDLIEVEASDTREITASRPAEFIPGLIELRSFLTVRTVALIDPGLAELETELAEALALVAAGKASPCPGGPLDVDGVCDEMKDAYARQMEGDGDARS
jgi:hypothetical protein